MEKKCMVSITSPGKYTSPLQVSVYSPATSWLKKCFYACRAAGLQEMVLDVLTFWTALATFLPCKATWVLVFQDFLKKAWLSVWYRPVVWMVVMVGGFGGGWQDGVRETLTEIKLCLFWGRNEGSGAETGERVVPLCLSVRCWEHNYDMYLPLSHLSW